MDESAGTHRLSQRFPKRRAFMTGAASGLGRELALELASAGWRLGLLDISGDGLGPTKADAMVRGAPDITTYVGDVAVETFVVSSIADFARAHGGIDVVVNDAGVAVAGATEVVPPEDWRWIVDINLLGVVWGCRAAVPVMREQDDGLVLNIASAAGFASAPRMAPYNVTKAAVIALSETLAGELAGSGIQVSCAMPGFFRSNLLKGMRAPPRERAVAERLMAESGHDAQQAARAILEGAADRKVYIVWPAQYSLLWRVKRLLPQWFVGRTRQLTDDQFS